ncbi:Mitochondrial substrate carrier family protein G [Chlorella vulgaris]
MPAVPETQTLAAAPPASGLAKFAKDSFAGTVGGIAVTMVGHPFDTVKVRLQTQPSANPIYSGAIDCVRKTLQWEGVGGLYKGVTSPLAGQMFFRATLFSAFGASKRWLGTNADGSTRALETLDFFKAGFITGAAAAFTEAPIDFYKSQIQVQILRSRADPTYKAAAGPRVNMRALPLIRCHQPYILDMPLFSSSSSTAPYTSVVDCVKATLRHSGAKGPFQGLSATLLRNAPANAIYLGSFEVLKQKAAAWKGCEVKDLSAPIVMAAGGTGGILYWLAIFPVDVIKSAMMTDSIDPAQRRYPSIPSTARSLWAEGGLARFYRGFSPCILRAAPANAVMLFTVDRMLHLLG